MHVSTMAHRKYAIPVRESINTHSRRLMEDVQTNAESTRRKPLRKAAYHAACACTSADQLVDGREWGVDVMEVKENICT
jgi:hypothetical protein